MTPDMQMRVKAFVRTVANLCDGCHRHGEACSTCAARRAKSVLREISLDEASPAVDYSFRSRVNTIRRILAEAGRPLLAKDIDLRQTCSSQLKYWTLNQMVYRRMIGRKFAFKSKSQNREKAYFFYFLKNKHHKDKETK